MGIGAGVPGVARKQRMERVHAQNAGAQGASCLRNSGKIVEITHSPTVAALKTVDLSRAPPGSRALCETLRQIGLSRRYDQNGFVG